MSLETERRSVSRDIAIDARPETVWELLVDPAQAVRWMGQVADFDVRPGGRYRVGVIPNNVASGRFVEIDPPRRLVLTWGWEPGSGSPVPPGSTTVVFELEPHGAGTLLHFSHRDLPDADAATKHGHGWAHYLERLKVCAAGGDPGRDPWIEQPMPDMRQP